MELEGYGATRYDAVAAGNHATEKQVDDVTTTTTILGAYDETGDVFTFPLTRRVETRPMNLTELFGDLAFIAVFLPLVNKMSGNQSTSGVCQSLLIYTATWWTWCTEAYYKNLFDPDDVLARFFSILQVVGLAGMGAAVAQKEFSSCIRLFGWCYALVHGVTVLRWQRTLHVEETRGVAFTLSIGFTSAIVLWCLASWHRSTTLAITAVAIDIGCPAPMIFCIVPNEALHIAERTNAYIALIIGGSVMISSQQAANGVDVSGNPTAPLLICALSAMVIAYSFASLYSSHNEADLRHFHWWSQKFRGYSWFYLHGPLSYALLSLIAAIQIINFKNGTFNTDDTSAARRLLCLAVSCTFVCLALFHMLTMRRFPRKSMLCTVSAFLSGAVALFNVEAQQCLVVLACICTVNAMAEHVRYMAFYTIRDFELEQGTDAGDIEL